VGFIFDMGGVLSLGVDVVPPIARKLGIPADRLLDFSGDDFHALSIGAMTAEEYWKAFNAQFGTDVREDLLIGLFHPVLDERVKRLILGLKAAGHRVVCGTNTFEKHYLYHLEHGDYSVFDRVYASHIIGIAKPDPAFFRHILEREEWPAGDAFFIDDNAANIAAAAKLGLNAHHYLAFEPLAAWLAGKTGSPAS
jgi:glucose-1-phosphatase